MPPTAIEIKARLDKAVDQEGNVLDMEAVLEIVASLEKIIMTKESLEATRIGKTINLMRKKTSNEDLSKRAKKLVKRWQNVVSNHFKISAKKGENLNGVVSRKDSEHNTASLNGGNGDTTHGSPTELDTKLALKRKRSSPDICSAKQSLRPGLSPRLVSSSPRPGVSPRLGVSPRRAGSPKIKAKPENQKLRTSGLVGADHGGTLNTTLNEELNCSDFLNHTHQNNEHSQYTHNQSPNTSVQCCNDTSTNKSTGTGASVTNSTDTRLQEDRIVLGDYISKSKKCVTTWSSDTTEIQTPTHPISTSKTNDLIAGEFPPIEPEDLKVVRKELPEDILSAKSEGDGINGVYDSKDKWCPWELNVEKRNKELLLLPYVILD